MRQIVASFSLTIDGPQARAQGGGHLERKGTDMFTIIIYDRAMDSPADVQTFETLERAASAAKWEAKFCASVEVHDPQGCCVAIYEGAPV